jgi:hypothetical protein
LYFEFAFKDFTISKVDAVFPVPGMPEIYNDELDPPLRIPLFR